MAALGFELFVPGHATPLHEAAWHGDLEMVQVLVELGASTEARDPSYRATPLGWASHNHQAEVVAYLPSSLRVRNTAPRRHGSEPGGGPSRAVPGERLSAAPLCGACATLRRR